MPRPSRSPRAASEPDAPSVSGRGFQRGPARSNAPASAPQHLGAVGGMLPATPGQTPFANAQVELGVNVAPSESNSNRVLTILLALMFTGGMALFVSALLVVVGFFVYQDQKGNAAVENPDDVEVHVRDSGVIEDPDVKQVVQRQQAYRQKLAEDNRDPMAEMFGGIGAGPVTIHKKGPGSEHYDGIEITCYAVTPTFRKRASFRGDTAHVDIVPAARCRLSFQGSVPVKSWVTGGDTRTCTFNPIVCR